MIIHIVLGAGAATMLFSLYNFSQKNALKIPWWQWVLSILGVIYALFVLEVIVGFLGEGAPQAALIMGLLTGIVAIIWGVLLKRFVFIVK